MEMRHTENKKFEKFIELKQLLGWYHNLVFLCIIVSMSMWNHSGSTAGVSVPVRWQFGLDQFYPDYFCPL